MSKYLSFIMMVMLLTGCVSKSSNQNSSSSQTPICSVSPLVGYCYSHGKPEISSLIKFCFRDMKKFNNCLRNEFKKKPNKSKEVEIMLINNQ